MRKLLLLLVMSLPLSLYSAPTPSKKPLPKPVNQSSVEGAWDMTWGGSEWKVYLGKDGQYACNHAVSGDPWIGSYTWDSARKVMVIHERHLHSEVNSWLLWTVNFNQDMEGKTQEGIQVHLKKPNK